MIAFGFLLLLVGIFVLINTFNGNLPGLVDIPGYHAATTAFRGLNTPASSTTTTAPGSVQSLLNGVTSLRGAIPQNVTDNVDSIAANATEKATGGRLWQ